MKNGKTLRESCKMEVKRGELWFVNLDATVGHEICKPRPAVIIQNDVGNRYSPLTIVAPITSQKTDIIYPVEVFLDKKSCGLNTDSKVLLNHIRAIEKIRLIKLLGKVDELTLEKIENAIKISLGLQ